MQVPLRQEWKQVPQFAGSLLRFTHRLPHSENPVEQLIWQPVHAISTSSQATVKHVFVQPVFELESGRQGPQCGVHGYGPPLSGRTAFIEDVCIADM